jgi:hypothetical protein
VFITLVLMIGFEITNTMAPPSLVSYLILKLLNITFDGLVIILCIDWLCRNAWKVAKSANVGTADLTHPTGTKD